MEKNLNVDKQSRLDIQLIIAFIFTRVLLISKEYWDEFFRLLQYFNWKLDNILILGANKFSILIKYINSLYAVRIDMKIYIGDTVSLGRGVILSKPSKKVKYQNCYQMETFWR